MFQKPSKTLFFTVYALVLILTTTPKLIDLLTYSFGEVITVEVGEVSHPRGQSTIAYTSSSTEISYPPYEISAGDSVQVYSLRTPLNLVYRESQSVPPVFIRDFAVHILFLLIPLAIFLLL